jgi:hypothetical protein
MEPDVLARLDLRAMAYAFVIPALLWVVMVVFATADGYPGVICATPVAWFFAGLAAHRCLAATHSTGKRTRLAEAGLTSVLLGVFQGLVASGVGFWGSGVQPDERPGIVLAGLVLALVGAGGAGAFGLAIAALAERRRE